MGRSSSPGRVRISLTCRRKPEGRCGRVGFSSRAYLQPLSHTVGWTEEKIRHSPSHGGELAAPVPATSHGRGQQSCAACEVWYCVGAYRYSCLGDSDEMVFIDPS